MMKQIGAMCIALALCFLMAVPCSAVALTESGGTESIEVYAKCIRTSDAYTAPAEDGKASVTLEDGTRVTVSDVTDSGLWLVVYPIPEEGAEAWSWFESCIAPYGTNIYPLDIYFVDQDGNRIEISGTITVTVEHVKDYTSPIVCYLATDGAVQVLESSVDGNRVTFDTTHNSYYVLAEQAAEPDEPEQPDNGNNGETDKPGQPDNGNNGAPDEPEQPDNEGNGEPDKPEQPDNGNNGETDKLGQPDNGDNGETNEPEQPDNGNNGETDEPEQPDNGKTDDTESPAGPTDGKSDGASGGTSDSTSGGTSQPSNPKTGDETNLGLWLSILCISGIALLAMIRFLVRRRKPGPKGN